MDVKMAFLYFSLLCLIFMSQIVDVLGYKFRCNKNQDSWPNSTAISGILFYLARLGAMFFMTLLAMSHEILGVSIFILDSITVMGLLLVIACILISQKHALLVRIILISVDKLKIFKRKSLNMDISYTNIQNTYIDRSLLFYGFLVNFFVLFCGLLPVNLIHIFPDFGMSLVYFSQVLSVVAGLSWYVLQEPRVVDGLNMSKSDICYNSLVLGKVASLVLTVAVLLVFMRYA